jgi:hypothetical protein
MYGDTQASLLHKFGIPEGTVHSWMKEENKFCSFVDSIVDLYSQMCIITTFNH